MKGMIRSVNGRTPRIAESVFVSEAAYIVGDVEIGEGSSVWPGAVIRADTGRIVIGKNTAIEDGCVIHLGMPPCEDVFIGDMVNIGHGAVVHASRIGSNVLIGINATVLHEAEIGDYCLIGAGCVVPAGLKVPDGSFIVGVPGKIRGGLTPEQLQWVEDSPRDYVELARLYKEAGL